MCVSALICVAYVCVRDLCNSSGYSHFQAALNVSEWMVWNSHLSYWDHQDNYEANRGYWLTFRFYVLSQVLRHWRKWKWLKMNAGKDKYCGDISEVLRFQMFIRRAVNEPGENPHTSSTFLPSIISILHLSPQKQFWSQEFRNAHKYDSKVPQIDVFL